MTSANVRFWKKADIAEDPLTARGGQSPAPAPRAGKRTVLLLEYSPQTPVGYTVNLLKASALVVPEIAENYRIECRSVSAQKYPFAEHEHMHTRTDNALLCDLMSLKPDVVGFSVFVWSIDFFSRFTRMLRLMNPHCKIIWGGKLVTNHSSELVAANPDVDCFCIGEGEIVFRNYLLHLLQDREPAEPLPGTIMKIGGRLQASTLPAPLPDPSSLPNPYVARMIDPKDVEAANIETLRGCIYHCTFCDWGGKDYRTFSDEYVEDVTKAVLAQGFQYIIYMDSVFGMKRVRRKKFLRTAIEHYNDRSKFSFEVMLEQLDDEECELFRRLSDRDAIGHIEIGLQSAHRETLEIIRRPFHPQRFVERYNALVRGAPHLQDVIQIDLIIGLPRETWQTFGEGLNFVFSLNPGKMSAFPLEVFPGSEMYGSQMQRYGMVALDKPPFAIISTQDMCAFEIQKLTVLTWVAIGIRSVARDSLLYLHHLTGERIFGVFEAFGAWCVDKGYVASWYEYGEFDDYVRRFLQFVVEENAAELDAEQLARLSQLLLFELAPFLLVRGESQLLKLLARPPLDGEYPSLGKKRSDPGGARRGVFWFDRLVRFPAHPESTEQALSAPGSETGLLVEANGDAYRCKELTRAQFTALLRSCQAGEVHVARNAAVKSTDSRPGMARKNPAGHAAHLSG